MPVQLVGIKTYTKHGINHVSIKTDKTYDLVVSPGIDKVIVDTLVAAINKVGKDDFTVTCPHQTEKTVQFDYTPRKFEIFSNGKRVFYIVKTGVIEYDKVVTCYLGEIVKTLR